jgi:hypothetical protein
MNVVLFLDAILKRCSCPQSVGNNVHEADNAGEASAGRQEPERFQEFSLARSAFLILSRLFALPVMISRMIQRYPFAWLFAVLILTSSGSAEEPKSGWIETRAIPAPEARQAEAADGQYVYAINSSIIAKYDRQTGERIALSHGKAHHLNSGFIMGRRMYCAHSNFPKKPERSEIKVLDLDTMELTDFHEFRESPHGSLTWAVWEQQAWWCLFARYGDENAGTVLVKFDRDWNECGLWRFPESVLSGLGKNSISGGLWRQGRLLMTGHDNRVLYLLEVPEQGAVLNHVGTVDVPFRGQGIAVDPVTGGLVGTRRKELEIVFAQPAQSTPTPADQPDR